MCKRLSIPIRIVDQDSYVIAETGLDKQRSILYTTKKNCYHYYAIISEDDEVEVNVEEEKSVKKWVDEREEVLVFYDTETVFSQSGMG